VSFLSKSGRPSLDYLGTVRWRRGPEPHEHLSQPSDLADWGTRSGLVTEPLGVTPAQLTAARELREVIYRVIFGRINGANPTDADVTALNAAARRSPVELSLAGDGAVRRAGTVSQLLSAVARDALDLLGSDQIGLVRECDGPRCTRLYVDSSRARNRRWCSNTECGNQAKVAAFRRRTSSLPTPVDADASNH
jgi:predicted RNA-binding Zn ribbon-like protein